MEELSKSEKAEDLRTMVHSRGWQNVVKPALQTVINATTSNVMTGSRQKGEEALSDEALKQRVLALNWVLGWEKRYGDLVQELEVLESRRESTEPPSDGGGPY